MKRELLFFIPLILIVFSSCKKESIQESVNSPVGIGVNGTITASLRLPLVESSVQKLSRNYRLTNIRSDVVNYKGYSAKWYYEYHNYENRTIDSSMYFNAMIEAVVLDSISTIRKAGNGIITHPWMDSDKALLAAENNGGREFRNNNPDYRIEAALGEPVIAVPSTFWYITYRSQKNNSVRLSLIIDAISGAVTSGI